MIVAFRRHTLLPLENGRHACQPSLPHLARSALHRCLKRHGFSRLPDVEGDTPKRQKFRRHPIGYFHIDIAEVQTMGGKLYLPVGIDRTRRFAVTQLVEKADRKAAWEFLERLLPAVPSRIHTLLTGAPRVAPLVRATNGGGIQFAEQPVGFFADLIRSTPLLVQLYFLFYILSDIGVLLSPLAAGVAGLDLHYSTYSAEVYRIGIDAISSGQWEASKATNLTARQVWEHIIIPQAIPPMIPVLANYFVAMFKETPLLAPITVVELMTQALSVANYYY